MRFEIETVTPLHVGSGSTYPLATEAVVDQNRLRRVSISKLSDLSENDRRKLERALKKLERASELKNREASRAVKEASRAVKEIGEVLKEGEFRYEAELKFKIDPVRMGRDKIRLNEIRECIKMADVPFIPGSSIKGAIRTALLWKYARENRDELHEYLGGKVEEIRRKMEKIRREVNKKEKWKIKEYKKVIKEYKKEIGEEFVKNVFKLDKKWDAKKDLLKFLSVSDFIPSDSKIEIKDVRTYFSERKIHSYVETVSGTFIGQISLNPQVRAALKSREYMLLSEKLGILGMDEPNEEEMLEHLKNVLREFNEWCLKKEIELVKQSELEKVRNALEDVRNKNKEEFLIRAGFGSGTIYQTLISLVDAELLKDLLNTLELGIAGKKGEKGEKGEKGKKGEKRRYEVKDDKLNIPYPKTLEFVDQKPLGWLKLS